MGLRQRQCYEEILDFLPESHPAAVANRKDIARLQRMLGVRRWLERCLRRHGADGEAALELACGDGSLAAQLVESIPDLKENLDGVDLKESLQPWAGWRRQIGDARTTSLEDYPVVFTVFFLHHLSDEDLGLLGRRLQESRVHVFLACETRRARLMHWGMPLFSTVLGLAPVSRYDARVSLAAGFRGRELAQLLGFDDATWEVTIRSHPLGAQFLEAVRR